MRDLKPGLIGAYVLGLAFAFGWTPCIGPVLAAILAVAGASDTVGEGAFLLMIYSLGLGIPFLAGGPLRARSSSRGCGVFGAILPAVEKGMGAFLVVDRHRLSLGPDGDRLLLDAGGVSGSRDARLMPVQVRRSGGLTPDRSLPDGVRMSLSSVVKDRILSDIAARGDEREAFLAQLVQTPSSNPPGDCAPIAEVAAELLEGLGLTVERHVVPDGSRPRRRHGLCTNLVVRRRFGDGPVIALNAHGDVVAPGEGWTHPPFAAEVVDGVMYGRGVAVSKSDFATYAFALLALAVRRRAGCKGAVELHFTFDEEIGGLIGPKWLLDQRIVKPDYCISAGLSYSIVTAHNGVPAPPGHGPRQIGACRRAGDRPRRAGGDDGDPASALRRAQGLCRPASRSIPASAIPT